MIFSRNRGDAGRRGGAAGRGGRRAQAGADAVAEPFDDLDDDVTDRPEFGPYDVSQAPEDDLSRLDLGALRIPTVAGVDIQLEAAPGGEIQRVQLAYGGSRLQLGAFAAPRTEGVWDEIRAELRTALIGGGAKLAEVDGEYGPELQARMGGGQGIVEMRHIGIDGPRWFVHGVYVGAAAVDPDQAGPLREALHGLVVDRGVEARPVKEPLPLRLPPEAAAQLAKMVTEDQTPEGGTATPPPVAAPGQAPTAIPTDTKPTPARGSDAATARGGDAASRRGSRGGRAKRTSSEAS